MTVSKLSPEYETEGDDLVLYQDAFYDGNLVVKGNIFCKHGKYSLTVHGNIKARNITVRNIIARNIDACDIKARNIDARNINVLDINAYDIFAYDIFAYDINALDINTHYIVANNIKANDILCEKRIKKTLEARTFARLFVQNRSKLKPKEQMPMNY